jgi:hypothetical protein
VTTGVFSSSNGFMFSGQAPAPPFTTSVTVTAIALALDRQLRWRSIFHCDCRHLRS